MKWLFNKFACFWSHHQHSEWLTYEHWINGHRFVDYCHYCRYCGKVWAYRGDKKVDVSPEFVLEWQPNPQSPHR